MAALCDRHSLVCQTDNVCVLYRWGENRTLGPVELCRKPARILFTSSGLTVDFPLDVATEILLAVDREVSRALAVKPMGTFPRPAPACGHAFACQAMELTCFYKAKVRIGDWGVRSLRNDRWPDARIVVVIGRFHHWLSIGDACLFRARLTRAVEAARAAQAVAP